MWKLGMELFSSTLKDDNKGVKNDLYIECKGAVLNIEEIITHTIYHFLNILGIAELYHTP